MTILTREQVFDALDEVKDPEIPNVSLVELGIVRAVAITDADVQVDITPTFAGCPALHMMREDIVARLTALGATHVDVRTVLSPAWTSEWIVPAAREKMKTIGLAPPPHHTGQFDLVFFEQAPCPHCGSINTALENPFGPTLCRSTHYCYGCRQSFDQFKPL